MTRNCNLIGGKIKTSITTVMGQVAKKNAKEWREVQVYWQHASASSKYAKYSHYWQHAKYTIAWDLILYSSVSYGSKQTSSKTFLLQSLFVLLMSSYIAHTTTTFGCDF